MHEPKSRSRHHQHADEPDPDGGPAARADPFAQHRPGQCCDKERGREYDREHLVEPQIFQREEIERRRAQQDSGAGDLEHGSPGSQQGRAAERIGNDEREQEGKRVARPHDLDDVDVAPEIFRGRVEA